MAAQQQDVDPAQDEPILRDVDVDVELTDPTSWGDAFVEASRDLLSGLLDRLPLIVLGLLLLGLGLLVTRLLLHWLDRGLSRARVDAPVRRLTTNLLRVLLILLVLLMAFSVAGVQVGAVLAGLGLAGLALAFALQNILENFVAGILLLIRKPFRRGDQIETNEYAGTVQEIDLRVTRLRDFDGELVLIPNATVFTEPIVNLTQQGTRRTIVMIGIDYRDDHDRARQVLLDAVSGVDGVRRGPAPEVLLSELGESSVDFEVAYWTAPDMHTIRTVRDRVLRTCKSAVEAEGLTIPWPIRTLAADRQPLRLDRPLSDDGGGRTPQR